MDSDVKAPSTCALKISEILSVIFSAVENCDQARCARVCKAWSTPALSLLWSELDSPRVLFQLLGPMTDIPAIYIDEPTIADFEQFHQYARFVRKITILIDIEEDDLLTDTEEDDFSISREMLYNVADLCDIAHHATGAPGPAELLPSLQTLVLTVSGSEACRASLSLLHAKITNLDVNLDECSNLSFAVLCQNICTRSPNISTLRISHDDPQTIEMMSKPFSKAVICLRQLTNLSIPSPLAVYPSVWAQLAKLPYFRSLKSDIGPGYSYLTANDVQYSFNNELLFVEEISLNIPAPTAHTLFRENQKFSELLTLRLVVSDTQTTGDSDFLLNGISTAAPALRNLDLVFEGDPTVLNFESISPILNMNELTSVEMVTDKACTLTDDDFAKIASALPCLVTLCISPDPIATLEAPIATIMALSHIASHCRKIRSVAIYVDTSAPRLPDHTVSISPFNSGLEEVDFGLSAASDTNEVALHLCRLFIHCDPRILSKAATTREEDELTSEITARYQRCEAGWCIVAVLLSQWRPLLNAVISSVKKPLETRLAEFEQNASTK